MTDKEMDDLLDEMIEDSRHDGVQQDTPDPKRPKIPALRVFVVRRMNPLTEQYYAQDEDDPSVRRLTTPDVIEEIVVRAHSLSFSGGTHAISFLQYEDINGQLVALVRRVFADYLDIEEVIQTGETIH